MVGDKELEVLCPECDEKMEMVKDYGLAGQAFQCKACGFYREDIDLVPSKLPNAGIAGSMSPELSPDAQASGRRTTQES